MNHKILHLFLQSNHDILLHGIHNMCILLVLEVQVLEVQALEVQVLEVQVLEVQVFEVQVLEAQASARDFEISILILCQTN